MEPVYETDSPTILECSPDDLKFTEASLLARLGYPAPEAVSVQVGRVLDDLAEPLRMISAPKAIARFVKFNFLSKPNHGFYVPGGYVFSTRLVSKALEPGTIWSVFALTVGEPENLKKVKNGDGLLYEYCADAIYSVMAEALAQRIQERLSSRMGALGLASGYRYSPGYCDWPISDNRALLSLLEAHKIGISLTEGGMMLPRKSVSGVIAFGDPSGKVSEPACLRCKNRCPHYRQ